ncbi:MAG: exodeoxyribonuclease VII large subunit [Oscillospiraceae bacterium]|nr:exodeoxyribonuclease VII large subunit [Oscillospiraceae bacterium]MBQ9982638.1 exodeoxyribonuclease VII large subunit [Oscillospiraceae bacterium]
MNILTVTQLNRYISFKLKEDTKLHNIFLRGEISNFKNAGHFYFTIKDSESLVKAVMFKSYASNLGFVPENGMNVIAVGSVSVFERDGVYQLYVTDMQPDGVGMHHIMFEKLKAELLKEGIFDEADKLPLPEFPRKIGIVTSEKGAALRDIINIIERRYPICSLNIYDSLVQGVSAPACLCEGLKKAESDGCDVIILGRGGGAYEDLQAFNDRQLAYCIHDIRVPVVSAVGHETDFTIADFVADMRAPTPSAAAELVVPSSDMLLKRISLLEGRLRSLLELSLGRKEEHITGLMSRMYLVSPQARLDASTSMHIKLNNRMENAFSRFVEKSEKALVSTVSKLEALNPLSVLTRGYSMVYSDDKIITSVDNISAGDIVKIKFSDGTAQAQISETEKI